MSPDPVPNHQPADSPPDARRKPAKRPANAYEALRERGWHDQTNSVRYCRWNSVRLFVPEGGGAILELAAFTGQAGTNGRRVEVLWSNRPLESDHLFSMAGTEALDG